MSRGGREAHGARRARVKAGTHWCVPCGFEPSLFIIRPAAGSLMVLAAKLMTAAPGRQPSVVDSRMAITSWRARMLRRPRCRSSHLQPHALSGTKRSATPLLQ
jgi:hypothetical protein